MVVGAGSFAAFVTLGVGTAGAEVEELAPGPVVTSRAATAVNEYGVRLTDIGDARGQTGGPRAAGSGIVHSQGETRDSIKAVPGSATGPLFRGGFPNNPSIGGW
jgi:hypothetical protein